MKTRKELSNWNFPKRMFKICTFLIFVLFLQLTYLAISPNIYGINMDKFAQSRNTVKTTLSAARGSIFDKDENVLALNVTSYTVIAYLSPKRTGSKKTPLHVVDKEKTAKELAPVLNMTEEAILKLLNKNVYQVELGPGGRGITELKKVEIENLKLPGIDFVESHKRYYPNGDFASYIIGYAKENDDSNAEITGELGIELKYNDILKGKDGYLEYQKDRFGYKIPDTKEIRVDAEDGKDVYLTIDSNIQRFVETAVKEASSESNPEWMVLAVMDAKTGDILGSASTPTFDPNKKNIVNYESPLVSFTYEPGSTMKTYSYMCAMEKGTYKGNATYDSSGIEFTDDIIRDWNKTGFGVISFDKGFEYSSNVGASYLAQRFIGKEDLRECLRSFGFGKITGVELPREQTGKVAFKYPIEIASASFGQGITSTAIQQLRALTIISNNGKMLTPHIVDKIVDRSTGEIIYQSKKIETKALVSTSTITKIKDLMYNVVNGTDPFTTGRAYKIDGYDIIGKTGTAQYVNARTGKYVAGSYIYAFSGMFPKDNPEIIVYSVLAKPATASNVSMQTAVQSVMNNIATYKNMFQKTQIDTDNHSISVSSYFNKNTDEVVQSLKSKNIKVITIGSGNKVIDQYPSRGSEITPHEVVILKTNGTDLKMQNVTGLSRTSVEAYLKLLGVSYQIDGYGYVTGQSILEGTTISSDSNITITLSQKYNLE